MILEPNISLKCIYFNKLIKRGGEKYDLSKNKFGN